MSKDPAIIEHYESKVLEKSGLCVYWVKNGETWAKTQQLLIMNLKF